MSTSLNFTLVETDQGVDQDASLEAARSAIAKHIAEREVEQTEIASAVTALFDQYKGQSIPMPTLGSMVAHKLNAQPENHKVLAERTLAYVRANAKGDSSLFVIGKGKGGGAYRRADRPAPAAQ